jgi:hypothetical protein
MSELPLIEGHAVDQVENNKKALCSLLMASEACIIFVTKSDLERPGEMTCAAGLVGKTDTLMNLCAHGLIQLTDQYPTITAYGVAKAIDHMNTLVKEQQAKNGPEIQN